MKSMKVLAVVVATCTAFLSVTSDASASVVSQNLTNGMSAGDSARAVQPATATGCAGDVCIFLTGSGTTVRSWSTNLYRQVTSPVCAQAVFWYGPDHHANNTFEVSGTICSSSLVLTASLGFATVWTKGMELCNSWNVDGQGSTGKACEVVG